MALAASRSPKVDGDGAHKLSAAARRGAAGAGLYHHYHYHHHHHHNVIANNFPMLQPREKQIAFLR